jgi:hypothetical protein
MKDVGAENGYREAIARIGKTVTFVAVRGEAPNVTETEAAVMAIVRDYTPTAPEAAGHVGAITEGARHIIVLERDLKLKQFPLPIRKNDKIIVDDEMLHIAVAEPHRRGFAGAIDVAAFGA